MNSTFKKIIGILASIFLISVAYYGSYLPLAKSQAFIDAMRTTNSLKSLSDFEHTFSVPLDMPSPIGQEELVRNTANIVLGVVQQNDKPEAIDEVVKYLTSYYDPIIRRGVGMSFEQNLYIMGAVNEVAFLKTKRADYFVAAKNYYLEGNKLGPQRPQFLYGLFDVYRAEGNIEGTKAVADQILSQWPDDTKTKDALGQFLAQVQNSQPISTTTKHK